VNENAITGMSGPLARGGGVSEKRKLVKSGGLRRVGGGQVELVSCSENKPSATRPLPKERKAQLGDVSAEKKKKKRGSADRP